MWEREKTESMIAGSPGQMMRERIEIKPKMETDLLG